ncbi:alkane 1-monooxygenase [Hoyosella subflava]|uniref:Alkane-1-monooxygenase n=1 Tax=Hoyosella subflava (strain DSM 45089 / JCM 17490 / NBRC 109087 / DQS3-9A1) TaxID=443218 RepID=F6EPU1_HOYSD|nr:alkane 1-monooxygenase [Hoyosella subflava]AEF40570.1 Alkane-1-monooxygenase [Hoyosella subflava DQS3-9A1]
MTSSDSLRETPVEEWHDKKRYWWMLGFVVPSLFFVMLGAIRLFNDAGWSVPAHIAWWMGPILVYILIPIIDVILGPDGSNPPDEWMERLEKDKYYRYILYAYIPLQYVAFVFACYFLTADSVNWLGYPDGLALIDKIGLTASIGMIGGIGINTAHELGHKKEHIERWLSKITLAQSFYGHFYVEHNRGHHVRVATPEDPASSRLGESFWAFWPRTVWGSVRSAWHLEKQRLARGGHSPWTIKNDVLNAWLMSIVLYAAVIAIFGFSLLPWLIVQAVIAFSLLEVVNYLEHYGLLREKTQSGRYERCSPRHSWNSDHICTNVFLYHLQRHSDHHAYPTRRYQILRSWDGAPSLPGGYASMIVLAYFPPIWRRVMDKRVLAHYDGDVTKANIQPSKRDKILAKYGASTDS